ncbi:AAA family ATPase, partial [Candidatus Micrarchaeota archaeon]|nr:AAA family ATPase [Candidatus Micrarchaeota archaeon]
MVIAPEIEAEVYHVLTRPYWNSWWTTGKVAWPLPPFKRSDFSFLAKNIEGERAVGLMGARQTGKTTMVMQLIEKKLAEGTDPRRILYAELDDEALQLACGAKHLLLNVLEVYQNRVLGENLWGATKPVYVFLDEVQAIPNWADTLKGMQPNPAVKCLVTGSA